MDLLLLLAIGCRSQLEPGEPAPPPAADTAGTPPAPTGDTGAPPTTPSRRLVAMLHGGGSEDAALYTRFVEGAGHGHVVTLGARELDDPYLYWFDEWWVSLGAASAETVNTRSRGEADDPAAAAAIDRADAVYVRGGDQALYVTYWRGTLLHEALLRAIDRGAVIGGSSAGCAILGERVYDAIEGSVYPWEALADPYDPYVTFPDGFLDLLPGVVTDTHFTERARLGRLAVFVERWRLEGESAPLGVGVDPRTALFVYDDGTAEVLGDGAVTIVDPSRSVATLAPGEPADIRGQRIWQLPAGYAIDLRQPDELVLARPDYAVPTPPPTALAGWPDLLLVGDDLRQRSLGEWQLTGLEADPYAWQDRGLALAPGDGVVPGALVLTGLYEDTDTLENHQGGWMWALSQQPGAVVVGVDIGLRAELSPPATLAPGPLGWAVVIDGRSGTYAGAPDTGWMTAALEEVTFEVIGGGETWTADP